MRVNHGGRWIPGPPTSWRSAVSRMRLTAGSTHAGKCRVGPRNGPYSQGGVALSQSLPWGRAAQGTARPGRAHSRCRENRAASAPAVTVNGVKPQR